MCKYWFKRALRNCRRELAITGVDQSAVGGQAERGVAADAVQAVFRNVGNLADGVGAQVGKFRGFEVAPDAFDWIEVGCVTRQCSTANQCRWLTIQSLIRRLRCEGSPSQINTIGRCSTACKSLRNSISVSSL